MSSDRLSHLDELARIRLASIVDSSDDAIVSKDLDGTVRTWNPACERIFGYTAEEMMGQPIFRVIPPELHDEERVLLARIGQGEHITHYETERLRKDGRRIRVSLTLSPLRDSSGRLIGASVIKRDVTAHRALEAKLQQALRMEAVGRLAGGIAHDFNNLLTVIGGLGSLTLRRAPEGSQEREDLEQIVDAATRASALTEQLLTFSRRQLVTVELYDLNAVVAGVEPLLRRLIAGHITVRFELRPGAGRVRANRAQLEQVVMNLTLNARDAMPDGGLLTVRTETAEVCGGFAREQLQLAPGRYAVLSVSDTGVGMDAVTQASIFEPFFTTKGVGEGTGLGLATVYAIAQQAGGAIYVYSEPGQGSVFRVYFPLQEAGPAKPEQPAAPPAAEAMAHGTILIAEDERGVRSFAAQVLRDVGYQVLEAANGAEALTLVAEREGPIALLITDIVMPGMSGRMLAERLRTIHPELPVLYTSGYTDDMVVRSGVVAQGAFLQKPFTTEQLLEGVRRTLARLPD